MPDKKGIDLKDEIINILKEALKPLSLEDLTQLINKRGNFEQLDGSPISTRLVENKIKTLPQFFIYEKGLVSLVDWEELGEIRDILIQEKTILSTKEIAEKINKNRKADQEKLTAGQIFLRVKRYPNLFRIEGDLVELITSGESEDLTDTLIKTKEKIQRKDFYENRILKEISLGNFKAFANKQSIKIKPITLIFGPNSSGKSSIIHILLYIHNAFSTGDLDPHYMKISGQSVDLGGFDQFVYKRMTDNPVQWGIKISTKQFSKRMKELLSDVKEINIEFDIRHKLEEKAHGELKPVGKPLLSKYEIYADDNLLIKMSLRNDNQIKIDVLNTSHSVIERLLKAIVESYTSVLQTDENDLEILREATNQISEKLSIEDNIFILKAFNLLKQESADYPNYLMPITKEKRKEDLEKTVEMFLPRILNEILEGIYQSIDKTLGDLIYLGPIRSYPERHIAFTKYNDPNWQAGGGLAWEIVRDNSEIRDKINQWLGNEDKLKTPYQLEIRKLIDTQSPDLVKVLNDFKEYLTKDVDIDLGEILEMMNNKISEIDEDTLKNKIVEFIDQYISDATDISYLFEEGNYIKDLVLVDKRSDTIVSHRDVGIGISQVLPVLAYAYANKNKIISIEQPEIHLHPALQAELADVFIKTALKNNNTYILETHSEHFILRLLRRIREGYSNTDNPEFSIDDINVIYIKPTNKGSIIYQIPVSKDGDFEENWPDGFFPERGEELFL
jgi:predicted ATPase